MRWIVLAGREGTAAKNLEAMIQLFQSPYSERCIHVSDDRHPGSLQKDGHMDYIIRKVVSLGADPISAIKMASYQPANYFGLRGRGAVAPGYTADFVVLSDLKNIIVDKVYKNGNLVAENGELVEVEGVKNSL